MIGPQRRDPAPFAFPPHSRQSQSAQRQQSAYEDFYHDSLFFFNFIYTNEGNLNICDILKLKLFNHSNDHSWMIMYQNRDVVS